MLPSRPRITTLEWDDANEAHIEEHIDAGYVEELLLGGDWVAYKNPPPHPPEYIKVIGRTPEGIAVTAIVESKEYKHVGLWRPVTAWPAEDYEINRYRQHIRSRRR
jgi:hypothetical protein